MNDQRIICRLSDAARELSVDTARQLREKSVFNPEDIHLFRVTTKRLRAYWLLAAPVIGKRKAKGFSRDLRDVARTLAGQRDDFVRSELLTELAKRARKKDKRAISLMRDELFSGVLDSSHLASTADDIDAATLEQTLQRDIGRWEDVVRHAESGDSGSGVRDGFQKTYALARDAGATALVLDTARGYHRWRRWVKYTYYQSVWLGSGGGPPTSSFEKRIKRLGSLLGRLHDVHQLEADLDARSLRTSSPRAFRRTRHAVQSRELELKEEIRRLAPKVFARESGVVLHKLLDAFSGDVAETATSRQGLDYRLLSNHEGDGASTQTRIEDHSDFIGRGTDQKNP